jgi:hypothetical protein
MNGRLTGCVGVVESAYSPCMIICSTRIEDLGLICFLQEYLDPQRVYGEVAATLQSNPFIRPRTNIFGSNFGRHWLI